MARKYDSYQDYLASIDWANLRDAKLAVNPRCERCGESRCIQVHHRRYRSKWEDGVIEDLETLCRFCHQNAHGMASDRDRQRAFKTYFRITRKQGARLRLLKPWKRRKAIQRLEAKARKRYQHQLDRYGNFILPITDIKKPHASRLEQAGV